MPTKRRSQNQRGFILLVSVLMLVFVLIPSIGLAVDAGILYAVKSRLQASVDAAALAAGRAISRGMDTAAQQAAATSAANRWFHANFPDDWMGVGAVANPAVTFPAGPAKTFLVAVAATVNTPTYFMKLFTSSAVPVTVRATSSRRDVNMIIVLDRSGSLYESGSCGSLSAAAQTFVDMFVNNRDKLGLVTFGTNYRVDYPLSSTFKTNATPLTTMLGSLVCYGYTNAAAGYWTGYQQLVALNDPTALNVIVFFTDGLPNAVTFGIAPDGTDNRLPVKTLTTPSTYTESGYNNANKSLCKDSFGRVSSNALWTPVPFTGVVSFAAGIYKKDAASYPASQAVDAVKIGAAEGNNGGCAFDAQFNNSSTIYYGGSPFAPIAGPGFRPYFDIAYLPEEDIFRNRTGSGYAGAAYATVNRYGTNFPAAYQGKIRTDDIGRGCCTLGVNDSLTNAGFNALDNAARRVRVESMVRNLNVATFTIGLGNTPSGVDNVLLRRVANDPQANNYDPAQPSGIYAYAPTSGQLNQAFLQVASEILRLSQ